MNEQLSFSRETCRGCHSRAVSKAVPLSPLPVASPNVGFSSKITESAAADVYRCEDCGLLQLMTMVNPEFQYRNFQYFTGISVGLREHFERLISGLAEAGELGEGKFVFDVGSNDGSLLRYAQNQGARVLGIDPAEKIAKAASEDGIPTIGDFFTSGKAAEIAREHGRADVIISNNTVANIDDLDDFFAGMMTCLADDGIIVIETQYALDVVQKFLLDVIYHEHLTYFAVKPTQTFFERLGLQLIDAQEIAPKGGSIRFVVQRQGGSRSVQARVGKLINREMEAGLYEQRAFDNFNSRIARTSAELKSLLRGSREQNGRALVFGASVGCAALVHYFDLGGEIDAVFDDTPLTNIMRTQQGVLPVLTGAQIDNEMPGDIVVLAWRYAANIARNHQAYCDRGGRFFTAIPEVSEVNPQTPIHQGA